MRSSVSSARARYRRSSPDSEGSDLHPTVAEYLLDIVQNSVEAGARTIRVTIARDDAVLTVAVKDDGCGMDEATLKRALDPFYTNGAKHPGRTVGLGLPFLSQLAEATGGGFEIASRPGEGTEVNASIPVDHLDAPPFGGLVGVLRQILCFAGDYEMVIERRHLGDAYTLRRSELIDALGEIETVGSQVLLQDFIASSEEAIGYTEAAGWQR